MPTRPIQNIPRPIGAFGLDPAIMNNSYMKKHITRHTTRGYRYHFNRDSRIPRPVPHYMSIVV